MTCGYYYVQSLFCSKISERVRYVTSQKLLLAASPDVCSHIALAHRFSSKRESARSLCRYRVKKGVPCEKSHPILGNVRGPGRNIRWRHSSRHLNSRFVINRNYFQPILKAVQFWPSTDSKDARPRVVPFILLALLRFHQ